MPRLKGVAVNVGDIVKSLYGHLGPLPTHVLAKSPPLALVCIVIDTKGQANDNHPDQSLAAGSEEATSS